MPFTTLLLLEKCSLSPQQRREGMRYRSSQTIQEYLLVSTSIAVPFSIAEAYQDTSLTENRTKNNQTRRLTSSDSKTLRAFP
jgi:hypothetical protein